MNNEHNINIISHTFYFIILFLLAAIDITSASVARTLHCLLQRTAPLAICPSQPLTEKILIRHLKLNKRSSHRHYRSPAREILKLSGVGVLYGAP